ncbi:hypothetical protein EI94DRAFT_1747747, partial [Lactarius quietus]
MWLGALTFIWLPRLLLPLHLMSSARPYFLPLHTWISRPLRGIVHSHLLISTCLPSPGYASPSITFGRGDVQKSFRMCATCTRTQDSQPLQSVLIHDTEASL